MNTEERLEKLEREMSRAKRRKRWLRMVLWLCLVAGLVVWASGYVGKQARVNRLVLMDEQGRDRAVLLVTKDGANLTVNDNRGDLGLVVVLLVVAVLVGQAEREE